MCPLDKGRISSNSDRLKAQLVQEGVGDVGEPFEILLYSRPGRPYDKKQVEEQVCKAQVSLAISAGIQSVQPTRARADSKTLEGLKNSITTFTPEVLF